MRRGAFSALALALLCAAGCSRTGGLADEYLGGGSLSVSHITCGETAEWEVSGRELDSVKSWAEGLRYKPKRFKDGEAPGDADGGEVYSFAPGDGSPGFSYYIGGPDKCYLLLDGRWYAVSNPSEPPTPALEG